MRACRFSDDRSQQLWVEPGTKLGELYQVTGARGRLLPAGSCAGVGVAGLTLGGGYGLFSREMGLTCDHLQQVRGVDGEGRIIDSVGDEELLWACRGGGNGNFAVITEFRFRTHPAPKRLLSLRFRRRANSPADLVDLSKRWFAVSHALPRKAFSAFVLNRTTLTVLVTSFEEHDSPAFVQAMKRFESFLGPARRHDDPLARAIRRYEGLADAGHFKNASAGYYRGFPSIAPVAKEIFARVGEGRGLIFQVNTLGGAIADEGFREGSAYAHRDAPFLGELQCYWSRPEQAVSRMESCTQIQGLLREAGIRAHYRNYPDCDFRDWEHAYYGEAGYARLRQVKARLDPKDRIRHAQSVRPPEPLS